MGADRAARVVQRLVCALVAIAAATPALAHDARPAYLEITQSTPTQYEVLWRTPVMAGMPLPVLLQLPEGVHTVGEPVTMRLNDSLLERRIIETGPGGLAGRRIDFPGLQATITDVLVRVRDADGGQATMLVRPSHAWVEVAPAQHWVGIAYTFFRHGVEHILFGYDHLLFVFALVLIVRNVQALLWTITSFTLAHSITLGLATLGVVRVPIAPVEAVIALSIVLLAYEIVRLRHDEGSVTARWPWVVAFIFGLLHGFGFAGALSGLGLPRGDIPLALFAFNVGVEAGQLAFIAVVLGIAAIVRRGLATGRPERWARPVLGYTIGVLACFWFIERMVNVLRI